MTNSQFLTKRIYNNYTSYKLALEARKPWVEAYCVPTPDWV